MFEAEELSMQALSLVLISSKLVKILSWIMLKIQIT